MNEPDLELFEQELRGLTPKQPPAEFMARLAAGRPLSEPAPPAEAPRRRQYSAFDWQAILRWLMPAAALAAAIGLVWLKPVADQSGLAGALATTSRPALEAGSVQIDEHLVDSFDAVGRLPSGEPVRFRYQKWMDELTVRDKSRQVVIEQRIPRVEVVPVRFETY